MNTILRGKARKINQHGAKLHYNKVGFHPSNFTIFFGPNSLVAIWEHLGPLYTKIEKSRIRSSQQMKAFKIEKFKDCDVRLTWNPTLV